jgi:hypothetical protein
MARGAIATFVSSRTGTMLGTETTGNTVDGHFLQNSGKTRFTARNSGASPYTVTIGFSRTVQGQTVTPMVKTIPAGETHFFGPFPTADYGSQIKIDVNNVAIMLRGLE